MEVSLEGLLDGFYFFVEIGDGSSDVFFEIFELYVVVSTSERVGER